MFRKIKETIAAFSKQKEPTSTYEEFQQDHPWLLLWEGWKLAVSERWCQFKEWVHGRKSSNAKD